MIPPRLAQLYPALAFTNRQRNLAARLLCGEDLRYGDLNRFEAEAAMQLFRKDVLTFAPATNRLHLVMRFADGSKAWLADCGWALYQTARPGHVGHRAAEWAAAVNHDMRA